jgi:hypothetical protein
MAGIEEGTIKQVDHALHHRLFAQQRQINQQSAQILSLIDTIRRQTDYQKQVSDVAIIAAPAAVHVTDDNSQHSSEAELNSVPTQSATFIEKSLDRLMHCVGIK